MPLGRNAPKLWPAEPRSDVDGVVGQARAAVALGDLVAEHGADGAVDVADRQLERDRRSPSRARARQLDQLLVERLGRGRGPGRGVVQRAAVGRSGTCRMGERSSPDAFQWSTAARCRAPRRGRRLLERAEAELGEQLAHLLGDELEEVHDELGLAAEAPRSSGFWVATPTGQVSRWQTRIMMQPDTTSGAVAKPNSSAPSSAAIITSRPVFSWPSACTTMRSRRPLSSSVCWVSARPSSHGAPACLSDVSGEAPVPPSCPR
jgi:hypothetical protein